MAIAWVRGDINRPATGTSATCTYGVAPSAGNMVLVAIGLPDDTTTVSSITDPNSSSFTKVNRETSVSGSTHRAVELWACASIVGTPASFTVNLSASVNFCVVNGEYSGVVSVGSNSIINGKSTNPSISQTLTNANDWLVTGVGTQGNPTYTAQNGNLREHTDDTAASASVALIDNTAASISSVTDSVTLSLTEVWAAVAVNLVSVSAGGSTVQNLLMLGVG